ncbi:hypothetical protein KCP69_26605 (plasmid) [Salmonella enterica subsp. enterica]|nr:hypothetical protein KCP69_26605 [Salmonella enterica subsp. enterica]
MFGTLHWITYLLAGFPAFCHRFPDSHPAPGFLFCTVTQAMFVTGRQQRQAYHLPSPQCRQQFLPACSASPAAFSCASAVSLLLIRRRQRVMGSLRFSPPIQPSATLRTDRATSSGSVIRPRSGTPYASKLLFTQAWPTTPLSGFSQRAQRRSQHHQQ